MEFRCRLGTPGGEIVEGTYVAESEARLRRDLEEKGLLILSLQRKGGLGLPSLSLPARRRRIPQREFLAFNQELATLLKAGMPLVQSLDILRERIESATFKSVLDDVHDRVKAGAALSESFAAHGDLFPLIYAATLTAGERAGELDSVVRRYVAYEKVISAVRRRTISALIYPAILVAMMVALVGIIVLRVVPAFSEFYAGFGQELPASTRVIVALSDFVRGNILLVAAALAAGAMGVAWWLRQAGQRERFDRGVLSLPWVGSTFRKLATSQLARTLATLLGGGIPLVNALETAARSMTNRFLAGEVETVGRRVREGEAFGAALRARGSFPDVAVKMVDVGESTGALQEMLNSLADFYDEEVEAEVARYITLIEPILLVLMGVVIAAVVLALYLPLFELSTVVR
ncbi:MAG: type II secretion system F family protein [Acidimicrobiia bacterium]|nr:type II secretion system F family protein [Acidimicrobiia bacterium]